MGCFKAILSYLIGTSSFRPLAGCGLFLKSTVTLKATAGFRPLAGCGLFLLTLAGTFWAIGFPSPCGVWVVSAVTCAQAMPFSVSVPLRGVGCFDAYKSNEDRREVSVPLRGVGCFRSYNTVNQYHLFPSPCGVWVVSHVEAKCHAEESVSVPLRGVGCFDMRIAMSCALAFPSPCGVWVVSGEKVRTKDEY